MEKKSRREFLREAGAAVLGAGTGLPLLATAGCEMQGHNIKGSESQWAMIIDVEKARDPRVRTAAAEACRRAHNIPRIEDPQEEIHWIWDAQYEEVFEDQVHEHEPEELLETPVLVLCNHCTNPPCVRVCPTQATWKRESDGVVMMDMHRCIGCRYCMAACPYGSRSFNWRDPRPHIQALTDTYPTRMRGVVEKCTFCDERLAKGQLPACVEACKQKALVFGDLEDPHSEIREVLARNFSIRRKPELGTTPEVYYVV